MIGSQIDDDAQHVLQNLTLEKIPSRLDKKFILDYLAQWVDKDISTTNSEHLKHLEQLAAVVFENVKQFITETKLEQRRYLYSSDIKAPNYFAK